MGLLKNSISALGRLITVVALAGTFLVGLIGVVYLQLRGEEITIPKVVGKNFNEGKDELSLNGLRIRRVASRYSNEKPNTILEQRPRAGTVAKTGLMISVVVSELNPDGSEEPDDVKGDDEGIEDIEALPELKTNKTKKKSRSKSKKEKTKTRDVAKSKDKKGDKATTKPEDKSKSKVGEQLPKGRDVKKTDPKKDSKVPSKKSKKGKKTPLKKKEAKKPATGGDTRSRKVGKSN